MRKYMEADRVEVIKNLGEVSAENSRSGERKNREKFWGRARGANFDAKSSLKISVKNRYRTRKILKIRDKCKLV